MAFYLSVAGKIGEYLPNVPTIVYFDLPRVRSGSCGQMPAHREIRIATKERKDRKGKRNW